MYLPFSRNRLSLSKWKEYRMKRKQKQIHYWIMVIPALLWLVLINIVPMGGIVMAFQDFNPGKGIFHSPWVLSLIHI